jgi:S-methylmethionine-dependent homocysteine/selenocysteine methylase
VNAAAVELLRAVRQQFADVQIILAGVIGPASDGYATDEALSADAAFAYHRDQADVLAGLDVDLLYAPTFPAFSELSGVARAMAETGRAYALAPMLHANGTMLDGTPLADAIARIDAAISPTPRHYMIGCLYPTHAQTALQALRTAQSALVKRVRGLKANASPLPPEDLDRLNHLAATDVQIWAQDELTCAREFNLAILGGCCGTDERYVEALARAAVDQGEPAAQGPKNVTILGLLWLDGRLHIVCPKDSQRYYLLFTRIHRLFAPLFTSIRTLLKTSTLPHRHDSTKTRNSACLA